jgi:trans-aconitate 2-methyltransferase
MFFVATTIFILSDKSQEWNSEIYHDISTVQEKWGQDVIRREKWIGNEIVMDAGCGTGRVTRILAQKVRAEGMVYAVDIAIIFLLPFEFE